MSSIYAEGVESQSPGVAQRTLGKDRASAFDPEGIGSTRTHTVDGTPSAYFNGRAVSQGALAALTTLGFAIQRLRRKKPGEHAEKSFTALPEKARQARLPPLQVFDVDASA